MPGRVLFLTYYFPPSGGPGVQRALKMVRYLPEFGWTPTVLTVRPEDAAYPNLDESLCAEIPQNLQLERTAAWDPYSAYARLQGKSKSETIGVGFVGESETNVVQRIGRSLRGNLFIPDARVGWVPFAIRKGSGLLESQKYDVIISTGPPHSVHLAARRLARKFSLPWLADMRDPWTGIDFYHLLPMTSLARKLDARMERMVLKDAEEVTVVSPQMMRGLNERFGRAYHVIQNGFDPADFDSPKPEPEDPFTISYIGNLNADRDPIALWGALADLKGEGLIPRLRVRLTGVIDPKVGQSVAAAGLSELVAVDGYCTHPEAVRRMRSASLLLLSINNVPGTEGIMTGKLYEYLASGRPVLGIGSVLGDAARVLQETGAGQMFAFEDQEGIRNFVARHYNAWKGGLPEPGASPEAIQPYSRREQTGRVAALLDKMTRPRP